MSSDEPSARPSEGAAATREVPAPQPSAIKTFLIADIRGYTSFTQTFGDESAARLAARFAEITRQVVEAHGGSVVELRGDEALVVFDSAREAVRAAVDLQARFVDETVADPSLPFAVGIGLDAGEAVPVEDGYRGGALNLAARLCAMAGPGEILGSREVVHLARRVEGVVQLDRPPVHLKGLADPVNVVALRREGWSPNDDLAFRRALGASPAFARRLEVANPYKGLRAFEEADAALFFGRDSLTKELVSRLGESRFLAVVGPSGSGKSSVVRAGLIPALRDGAIPGGSERWVIVDILPGAHPWEELEAALLRVAVNPPSSLIDQLRGDELGLVRAVKRVLPSDDGQLLLFIDQLEEVFTLVDDEETRTSFLSSIHQAVGERRGQLRVVTTLRADFYDRPLLYRGFADLMRSHIEAVVPLSPEELEAAIVNPAKSVGAGLEPGLLAELLAEVAAEPGALPLLQYALTELFDRREGNTMTVAAYRAIGGVTGALAGRADEVYAALSSDEQEASRQLFLRLVTLGEGTEDTRRRVLQEELGSLEVDQPSLAKALDVFGASRLLSFDVDARTRRPTVEVAHEALLRTWSRLRSWIDEAREDVRTHRRLVAAATEWRDAGRDSSFLVRGSRLEQLEAWAGSTRLALTGDERAYVQASLEKREAERSEDETRRQRERVLEHRAVNRLRSLVAVFSVLALVASGLTVYSFRQRESARRQSRIAIARELAAAAIATVDSDPQLSVLEAIQAIRTTKDVDGTVLPEAEGALHRAVQGQRLLLTIPRREDLVSTPQLGGVAWSPDGSSFATTSDQNTATVWNAVTGARILTLKGHEGRVTDVAFSPDGTRVATASSDRTARIWDAQSGRQLAVLQGHQGVVSSVAFSPDGGVLATGGWDATARTWDVETGRSLHVFHSTASIQDISWSPDGTRLATILTDTDGPTSLTAVDVWDVSSGRRVFRLSDRVVGFSASLVDHVAFDPTGTLIAATGVEVAVLWDARTGKRLADLLAEEASLPGSLGSQFTGAVAFRPDGSVLALGGSNGSSLVVTNDDFSASPPVTRGQVIIHVGGASSCALKIRCAELGRPQTDLSYSPDGSRLAIVSNDGTTRIWDVSLPVAVTERDSTGGSVRERLLVPATGDTDGPAVAFSRDGSRLAATTRRGIAVWDVASGRRILTVPVSLGDVPTVVAFSPDGSRLATSSDETGQQVPTQSGNQTERVALKIRDLNTGVVLLLPGRPVEDLAFSPDGRILATVGPDGAKLWNASTGQQLLKLPTQSFPDAVSFSPDGRLLATGATNAEVILWDPATGARVATLSQPSGVQFNEPDVARLTFSHDGRHLATASLRLGGQATIWDVATRKKVLEVRVDAGGVEDVAFSPDGSRLALAFGDGEVNIRDSTTGASLFDLTEFGRAASALAYSPDGRLLASIAADGTLRVDLMNVDDLIKLAEGRVTRKLAPEECRQVLHLTACPTP